MGSMDVKVWTAAMASMAAELSSMANRDDVSRCQPINFQPSRNRGTFITMVIMPTDNAGTTALMTCARPVMPPRAT